MTSAPAVSMKRIDDMSIDELYAERADWSDIIERGWGPALDKAIDVRTGIDAVIARKLRQTEGDALPPDQRLPDTPNLQEAAA